MIWIAGCTHSGTTVTCQVVRDILMPGYNETVSFTEDPVIQTFHTQTLQHYFEFRNKKPISLPEPEDIVDDHLPEMTDRFFKAPKVIKDPWLSLCWPFWHEADLMPDRWIITQRNVEPLVRSNHRDKTRWPEARLAFAQQVHLLAELANVATVFHLPFPDVLMRIDRFGEVVADATGVSFARAMESVKKYVKPERYRMRV